VACCEVEEVVEMIRGGEGQCANCRLGCQRIKQLCEVLREIGLILGAACVDGQREVVLRLPKNLKLGGSLQWETIEEFTRSFLHIGQSNCIVY